MHSPAMERAGYGFRCATFWFCSRRFRPPRAELLQPATSANSSQVEPNFSDLTEAEQYSTIYPDRAGRMRGRGGLPMRLDFDPPEARIVEALSSAPVPSCCRSTTQRMPWPDASQDRVHPRSRLSFAGTLSDTEKPQDNVASAHSNPRSTTGHRTRSGGASANLACSAMETGRPNSPAHALPRSPADTRPAAACWSWRSQAPGGSGSCPGRLVV
jgi:hypothetical protein